MERRLLITLLVLLILAGTFGLFAGKVGAAKQSAPQEYAVILKKLTVIDQKVDQVLQGQAKLAEEHTQLRYWINKRR